MRRNLMLINFRTYRVKFLFSHQLYKVKGCVHEIYICTSWKTESFRKWCPAKMKAALKHHHNKKCKIGESNDKLAERFSSLETRGKATKATGIK